MTDAMSDAVEYWQRKCGICKIQNPELYAECGERGSHSIVYPCKAKDIRVY